MNRVKLDEIHSSRKFNRNVCSERCHCIFPRLESLLWCFAPHSLSKSAGESLSVSCLESSFGSSCYRLCLRKSSSYSSRGCCCLLLFDGYASFFGTVEIGATSGGGISHIESEMNVASAATAVEAVQALNPIEALLLGFNTNPYFIGLMMLLLNLGGRFLAMEITKEQEKFFQNPWFRRVLIFVVIFVATRNVFVAFWMALIIILILGFVFNENSALYILKPSVKGGAEKFQNQGAEAVAAAVSPLTPEEADIHKKLSDKLARAQAVATNPEKQPIGQKAVVSSYDIYQMNMMKLGGSS